MGVPFTDPIADGPTIQKANTQALANGVTIPLVLDQVRTARSRGLRAPVLLMGYYNPLMQYGEELMLQHCKDAGVNGFIMVDLPPEEAVRFRDLCASAGYVSTASCAQIWEAGLTFSAVSLTSPSLPPPPPSPV